MVLDDPDEDGEKVCLTCSRSLSYTCTSPLLNAQASDVSEAVKHKTQSPSSYKDDVAVQSLGRWSLPNVGGVSGVFRGLNEVTIVRDGFSVSLSISA